MTEGWERYYAKFFNVLVFVVLGIVVWVIGSSLYRDRQFAVKMAWTLGPFFLICYAISRLMPRQWKNAIGEWTSMSRLNAFIYFGVQFAILFAAVQLLFGGKIHWTEFLINVVAFTVAFTAASPAAKRTTGENGADKLANQ